MYFCCFPHTSALIRWTTISSTPSASFPCFPFLFAFCLATNFLHSAMLQGRFKVGDLRVWQSLCTCSQALVVKTRACFCRSNWSGGLGTGGSGSPRPREENQFTFPTNGNEFSSSRGLPVNSRSRPVKICFDFSFTLFFYKMAALGHVKTYFDFAVCRSVFRDGSSRPVPRLISLCVWFCIWFNFSYSFVNRFDSYIVLNFTLISISILLWLKFLFASEFTSHS